MTSRSSLVFKHVKGVISSKANRYWSILVPVSISFARNINYCLPFSFFRTSAGVFQESVREELWPLFYGEANALTATRLKTKTSCEKRAHHFRIFLQIRPHAVSQTTRHVALISFPRVDDFRMLRGLCTRDLLPNTVQ